jgi:hypothetical protein
MNNKKLIITGLLWAINTHFSYSQYEEYNCDRFLKRIEHNMRSIYHYNLDGKSDIERLFFGDFNAPVEFAYLPEGSDTGFRVVKDTSNTSYRLEIKYISNYKEAVKEARMIAPPPTGTSISPYEFFHMTEEKRNEITAHNIAAFEKSRKERLKLYKIETQTLPVSDEFAEVLYEKMVLFIHNFKAKGVPPASVGGYSCSFRTVVDEEVWSLNIHMPKGDALKWSDFCRQIINDAITGNFDGINYELVSADYLNFVPKKILD